MPRFPRNYLKTSFFHVMSQGINKNFIFEDSIDIKFYIKNMYEIKDKYNVKIIAYCIMNNHVHMLLETAGVENLSKYMHCLNTRFGQYYNKKYKRVGYVFRDRYKAEGIYSEKQLYNCIKYIYDNPVKAEICKKPE
ncbi:MAG: transposase [Clostridia bacterium]